VDVERAPFGHYDGEQQSLDRTHQLRRKPRSGDRCSFGSVATALNQEAVATRSGKLWTRATVQKICAANGWEYPAGLCRHPWTRTCADQANQAPTDDVMVSLVAALIDSRLWTRRLFNLAPYKTQLSELQGGSRWISNHNRALNR
jgi:hypothetical protein